MQFTFFECRDGSFVMPQNMYPGLRKRAEEFLGVPLTRAAVTEAIGSERGPGSWRRLRPMPASSCRCCARCPELMADRAVLATRSLISR